MPHHLHNSAVLLLGSGLFFGIGVSILAMLTVKRRKMEER